MVTRSLCQITLLIGVVFSSTLSLNAQAPSMLRFKNELTALKLVRE